MVPVDPPVRVPPGELPVDPPIRVPPGEVPEGPPDDPPTGTVTGSPPVPTPGCAGDGTSVVSLGVEDEGTLGEGLVGPDGSRQIPAGSQPGNVAPPFSMWDEPGAAWAGPSSCRHASFKSCCPSVVVPIAPAVGSPPTWTSRWASTALSCKRTAGGGWLSVRT